MNKNYLATACYGHKPATQVEKAFDARAYALAHADVKLSRFARFVLWLFK